MEQGGPRPHKSASASDDHKPTKQLGAGRDGSGSMASGILPHAEVVHTGEAIGQGPTALACGATGVARLCCSLDKLEVEDGLQPSQTKADATRWGCRVAWDHVKELVQRTLRQRLPMSVREGPGDKLEVAMDLRPEQVRSVVRQSGKHAGVEFWVGRPSPPDLTTTTVWVNLATERRVSAPVLWAKLQAAPWFASLRSRDRPGRIVVSVWAPAPVA